MINLKKNDKLIVIIAVVVIIFAGIGIAVYSPSEEKINKKAEDGRNVYSVDWDIKTSSFSILEFAGKDSPYEDTFSVNHGNLKELTFNLSWVDDKATILNRFGLDKLTLEVTTPGGETLEEHGTSAKKTKEGNIVITIPVNGIPSSESIRANDSFEAEQMLNDEPYYNDKWANEEFSIKVAVQIGEIRILKKLRDRGNDFELEISYEYYDATLTEEEMMETGSGANDDTKEEEYTPNYMSMIIGTGCGRFI